MNSDPTYHLDQEPSAFVLRRIEMSARDAAVLQIWHLPCKTKQGCPYPLKEQDVFLLLPTRECQPHPSTIPSERSGQSNRDNNPISLQLTLLDILGPLEVVPAAKKIQGLLSL